MYSASSLLRAAFLLCINYRPQGLKKYVCKQNPNGCIFANSHATVLIVLWWKVFLQVIGLVL